MYNIHLLPAAFGDAILIEYGAAKKTKYIFIDGGPSHNFSKMLKVLKAVAPKLEKLELLVITHIDIDHIDGIITLLNGTELPFEIEDIWFNDFRQISEFGVQLGPLQGEYLAHILKKKKLPHNKAFSKGPVAVTDYEKLPAIKLPGGMKIELLSPGPGGMEKIYKEWAKYLTGKGKGIDFPKKLLKDKRYETARHMLGNVTIENLQAKKVTGDDSAANGSSIAFIATYAGKSCLFAGDATSDYLLEAIEPKIKKAKKKKLILNAWKLAHHGSKKSNLDKLMQVIDCKKMLISTGGTRYKHPDEVCIAKLIGNNGPNLEFHFNYASKYNKRWEDATLQKKYKFKSFYPDNPKTPGITIEL